MRFLLARKRFPQGLSSLPGDYLCQDGIDGAELLCALPRVPRPNPAEMGEVLGKRLSRIHFFFPPQLSVNDKLAEDEPEPSDSVGQPLQGLTYCHKGNDLYA